MKALKRWLVSKAQWVLYGLLDPVITPLTKQVSRLSLPERERTISNPVLACGRRFFSQNDEDGILLEILRRIDLEKPSTFLEIGVGNGTECNTIILLARGWRGAWIGNEPLGFDLPADARLAFSKALATPENIASLASSALERVRAGVGEVRVASIDIDGNDAHIVRALLTAGFAPDVFVVEYNARFPPGVEFEMPYDESHVYVTGADFMGVSLQRWATIFSDYRLITCNENGVNAFFVKRAYATEFADVSTKMYDLFRISHAYPYLPFQQPASPRTVKHLATMPIKDC